MKRKSHYYKTGLFIISGMILFMIFVIMFGAKSLFEKKLMLETYFDESVQGLDIGSLVKFRGVVIGSVKKITFVQDEYDLNPKSEDFYQGRYVLVKISLKDTFHYRDENDFKEAMSKMKDNGLRIKVTAQGLTGTSYLELDYVNPENNIPLKISWAPKNYYIPSTRSTFTKIGASVDELINKVKNSNIEQMLGNIDKLVVTITNTIQSVEVSNLSKEVSVLLQEVRMTNTELRRIIASPEMQRFPARLEENLNNISKTTSKLNGILTHNNYDITTTVENLRVVSEDLKEITGNAKKYPSLIFFGEAPTKASLTNK